MKTFDPRGLSAPAMVLFTCTLPPFSKIFFSIIAWPIKAKFYVEPLWEGGEKVNIGKGERKYTCINGPGHMTKIAAMPIYGKNLQNLLLQN